MPTRRRYYALLRATPSSIRFNPERNRQPCRTYVERLEIGLEPFEITHKTVCELVDLSFCERRIGFEERVCDEAGEGKVHVRLQREIAADGMW